MLGGESDRTGSRAFHGRPDRQLPATTRGHTACAPAAHRSADPRWIPPPSSAANQLTAASNTTHAPSAPGGRSGQGRPDPRDQDAAGHTAKAANATPATAACTPGAPPGPSGNTATSTVARPPAVRTR
jgi:hypothetical protein